MNLFAIETGIFGAIELFLLYLRNLMLHIVNDHFAVEQMAIETGYKYDMAVKVIENTWLALAIACAVIYAAIVLYNNRKDNE